MESAGWLDRVLKLPPRQLEMTPLRAAVGIAAPIAIAVAIVIFYYPFVLRIFVFDAAQYQSYVQNLRDARPLELWLPIVLTPLSNMSTLVDMVRGRQLSFGRRLLLFAIVWALSIVPTTLYWFGEFRKAARQPAVDIGPEVEAG